MIREKQDGEDMVLLAVDRSNAASATEAMRINGNTGLVTLAPGSIGAPALAAAAVTPVKTAPLLRSRIGLGADASGGATHINFTGARVGDLVVHVLNLTDGTDVAADFEAAVTVAGQLQQSAVNLSAKTLLILLQRQS